MKRTNLQEFKCNHDVDTPIIETEKRLVQVLYQHLKKYTKENKHTENKRVYYTQSNSNMWIQTKKYTQTK